MSDANRGTEYSTSICSRDLALHLNLILYRLICTWIYFAEAPNLHKYEIFMQISENSTILDSELAMQSSVNQLSVCVIYAQVAISQNAKCMDRATS